MPKEIDIKCKACGTSWTPPNLGCPKCQDTPSPKPPEQAAPFPPREDEVKWIVNDYSELGVEIGGRCYFLYKGRSYGGGNKYREVYKREFGECCHPWGMIKYKTGEERLPEKYIGFMGEDESEWKDVVPAEGSAAREEAPKEEK